MCELARINIVVHHWLRIDNPCREDYYDTILYYLHGPDMGPAYNLVVILPNTCMDRHICGL